MLMRMRCPCGCGIAVNDEAAWRHVHFDAEGRCRLCGRREIDSFPGLVTLLDGSVMSCPLCAFGVAEAQLLAHAEQLRITCDRLSKDGGART
jgi:hypothetical protein